MYRFMSVLLAVSVVASAAPPESAELAALREQMRNRKRRVIYNNDGCDVFKDAATPEAFLSNRMTSVTGPQGDYVRGFLNAPYQRHPRFASQRQHRVGDVETRESAIPAGQTG